MMTRLALWLALRIVDVVAVLVPAAARGDWRREWDAELRHRSAHARHVGNPGWRINMSLISRALGALPDAAWIRRQFTLDADAVHDTVHGVRMLLKTPAFTAIALIVFALGIGATTAILSVVDALLLRPMPVPQPERVTTVWQYNRETGAGRLDVAPANALDWLKRARSFETLATVEPFTFNINFASREPDYLTAARVSEQFFSVLRTPVLYGRIFLPQEYRRGGPRVVVFSHLMWRDRCGSDPSIVGRAVRLDDGDSYTVVGVMPPRFELRLFNDRGRRPEPLIWLPKQGFDDFEPKHYSFKPAAETRSFGESVAHVADSQARTCSLVNGDSQAVNAASRKTKAELVAALKESCAICDAALDALTDAAASQMVRLGQSTRERSKLGLLIGMTSHSNEQYGYMAVYLRLNGIVPPSSESQ